jgi:hypothetical protein
VRSVIGERQDYHEFAAYELHDAVREICSKMNVANDTHNVAFQNSGGPGVLIHVGFYPKNGNQNDGEGRVTVERASPRCIPILVL